MNKIKHALMTFLRLRFVVLLGVVACYFILLGAGSNKLEVQGDLNISSPANGSYRSALTLAPLANLPVNAEDGTFGYNVTDHKLYGRVSGSWQILGGTAGAAGDKYPVTRIVAARNSIGTACGGVDCTNPRSDYTCNGTDDGGVINGAVKYVNSRGGGIVYLLEGVYNFVSGTVAFNQAPTFPRSFPDFGTSVYPKNRVQLYSNVAIVGTGKGTILKIASGTSVGAGWGLMEDVSNSAAVENAAISQLMIDGNNKTGSENHGIHLFNSKRCRIENIWIENLSGAGIYLDGAGENIVSNCNVRNNGLPGSFQGHGIYLRTDLAPCTKNIITGNHIRNNAKAGIYLANFYTNENTIYANNIRDNSGYGIGMEGSVKNRIYGNNIQHNGDGIYINTNVVGLSPGDVNFVSANNIFDNTGYGISITSPFFGAYISANNIRSNVKDGIYVSGVSKLNVIANNMIRESGSTSTTYHGIRFGSGCAKNYILNNHISDTTPVLNSNCYGIYMDSANSNWLFANQIIAAGAYIDKSIYQSLSLSPNNAYMDKLALTFPARERVLTSGDTLDPVADNTSHYLLSGFGSLSSITAIANGRTVGEVLILEAKAGYGYTVRHGANTSLGENGSDRYVGGDGLNRSAILVLIWNGSDWLEVMYTDDFYQLGDFPDT